MKNVLLDKGIILPSGEISKDKVNLVTGAITQPFAEMVWVTTGGDMETVNRLTDVLVTMNTPADRGKLFKIIKMLYSQKAKKKLDQTKKLLDTLGVGKSLEKGVNKLDDHLQEATGLKGEVISAMQDLEKVYRQLDQI